MVITFKNYILS